MFSERLGVKEAKKIKEEAMELQMCANEKMKEFHEMMEKERQETLKETSDLSVVERIREEIKVLEARKRVLFKVFDRKRHVALGYGKDALGKKNIIYPITEKQEEEYKRRMKKLEAEYKIEVNKINTAIQERYSRICEISEEKQKQKEELCKIFGCRLNKKHICTCCGKKF